MAKLGDLAIGSIVKLSVNGSARNFIVVHQGNPNASLYDASCDGTWLLMQDIYVQRKWHSSNINDYENSDINSYLNSTFLNLLDDVKDIVKEVKIPYRPGRGENDTVASGSNGLSTKVFLLSYKELGYVDSSGTAKDGYPLSYFNGAADSVRIGYYNGTAVYWWLRTPDQSTDAWDVLNTGVRSNRGVSTTEGIRPAFLLSRDINVKDDGTIVTKAINGYAVINGSWKSLTGKGYVNVEGVWKSLIKAYGCVNSVWESLNEDEDIYHLPDNYTRLAYIESSGTQYIDTGYKANNNTRMEITYYSVGTNTVAIAAGEKAWKNNGFGLWRAGAEFGNNTKSGLGNLDNQIVKASIDGGVVTRNGTVSVTLEKSTFQTEHTMFLFATHRDGSAAELSSGLRIYSFKLYESGVIVRNLIPCINSNNEVGMYDLVTCTFYQNKGTGEFIASAPVNLTETEYIQFTGSQWIDTGLKLPSSYKIELGFTPTSSYGTVCGVQWSSPKFELCVWENSLGFTTANTAFTGIPITPNSGRYDLICENNAFTVNGSKQTKTVSASNSTAYNLMIGAHGSGEISDYRGQMKLYYFKLYDNNKIVRDFVPCINSVGAVGLWDRVTDTFYSNAGTGSFVAGN